MQEMKLKTNLNCSHCVGKVTTGLNDICGIVDWKVDLENEDKILTVKGENFNEEAVKNVLKNTGYNIEKI